MAVESALTVGVSSCEPSSASRLLLPSRMVAAAAAASAFLEGVSGDVEQLWTTAKPCAGRGCHGLAHRDGARPQPLILAVHHRHSSRQDRGGW